MNREILILSKFGIPCKKYKLLMGIKDKNNSILSILVSKSSQCLEILGEEKFEKLKTELEPKNIDKYVKKLHNMGMKYILCEDNDYPIALKCSEEYPLVVYYVGDKTLLTKNIITIVGSRMPTNYGEWAAEKFTKDLVGAGLVTMSGLAYGIDSIVAKTTLAAKGKTIAFLAGGLDKIYPEDHTELARKIVKNGGLVMSTYPPYKSALKFSFLERNKIMSLLSKGTLIVEAGLKSGTISTANYTIDNGRELFVVPGNVNSQKSEGSNFLIEQFPETFTISSEKICARLGVKYQLQKNEATTSALDDDEVIILAACLGEEKSLDEISNITKLESKFLLRKLTIMEINGLIKKLPGNFYIGIKQN